MNAIVTGGAGFIGSNLALTLEKQGVRVTIVDDFSGGNFENIKNFRGKVIAQDINQVAWDSLKPVDVIFHEAALTDTTVTDQKKMMSNNVEGFRKILHFALQNRIKLVYASSAGVYGNEPAPQSENGRLNPLNIYAYSKLVGDQIALQAMKASKMLIVGLRYFNVFGLGEKHKGKFASMIYQLAEQMRSGKRPRIFHDGEQMRDHIYVRDAVDANLMAFEAKEGGIFNVGTGKATSFNRVIEILNEVLGANLSPDYFDNPYGFYQNRTQADTAQAERLLGFNAKWSIEEGIREYLTALHDLKSKKAVSIKV
ncbi:MAG: ADP-glyceromanno-heptose 6-epimerase [Candidatus Omnitrophica bacterium]|nr:ADP-glyceromanno-heptose 6-epimerase [Candidatus Omnitrophota bacterium]